MKVKSKNKSGFTLIEIIIAVVIAAVLMTAVAVAFDASAKNYAANEGIYESTNKARQALQRITANIRASDTITLPSDETNNKCTMTTAEGKNYTYDYRSGSNSLYIVDNDTTTEYLLCGDVTNLVFTKGTGDLGGVTVVKNVRITMEVTTGGQVKTLSGAAVARKMME